MTSSKRNIAFTAAGVVAVLALGAGAGAGVYASVAPASTTTVVRDVGSAGALQNASDTSAPSPSRPSTSGRTRASSTSR